MLSMRYESLGYVRQRSGCPNLSLSPTHQVAGVHSVLRVASAMHYSVTTSVSPVGNCSRLLSMTSLLTSVGVYQLVPLGTLRSMHALLKLARSHILLGTLRSMHALLKLARSHILSWPFQGIGIVTYLVIESILPADQRHWFLVRIPKHIDRNRTIPRSRSKLSDR